MLIMPHLLNLCWSRFFLLHPSTHSMLPWLPFFRLALCMPFQYHFFNTVTFYLLQMPKPIQSLFFYSFNNSVLGTDNFSDFQVRKFFLFRHRFQNPSLWPFCLLSVYLMSGTAAFETLTPPLRQSNGHTHTHTHTHTNTRARTHIHTHKYIYK